MKNTESDKDNLSNIKNVLTNEKKLMELIDDHLSFKGILIKKRKLYANKKYEIISDIKEKDKHIKSFLELLEYENNSSLLYEYNLIDYLEIKKNSF